MYAIMDILDVIYFEQGLFWYQILDTLLNSYSSINQYSVLLFKRIARFTDENHATWQRARGSRFSIIAKNLHSVTVDVYMRSLILIQ